MLLPQQAGRSHRHSHPGRTAPRGDQYGKAKNRHCRHAPSPHPAPPTTPGTVLSMPVPPGYGNGPHHGHEYGIRTGIEKRTRHVKQMVPGCLPTHQLHEARPKLIAACRTQSDPPKPGKSPSAVRDNQPQAHVGDSQGHGLAVCFHRRTGRHEHIVQRNADPPKQGHAVRPMQARRPPPQAYGRQG